MEKKKSSFSKLLADKRFTIPLSVILALIVWLVITTTQTTKISRTIEIPIEYSVSGTVAEELGLDIVDKGNVTTASVEISGPSYIVSSLNADDIKVAPSFTFVNAPGSYTLKLTATAAGNKSGFEISKISPEHVNVSFDIFDTKDFTVIGEANGITATKGLSVQSPATVVDEYKTITVSGPKTELDKISEVRAVSDKTDTISKTTTYDAKIVILDENGSKLNLENCTLSFSDAKISVIVLDTATVPVSLKFVNAPENSASIPYTISVPELSISGSPELIAATQSISTMEIDFNKINIAHPTVSVELDVPTGIFINEETVENVTITFDLSSYSETTVSVKNITPLNVSSSLKATVNDSLNNVKICGTASQIASISQDNIIGEVDLTGKSAGRYTVQVTIKAKNASSVWVVGTYSVSATIK